jgi:3-oxoacyl-[acyl-carrier protein] reductase
MLKVALVTGSSRGLGRHIALRLARENFAVAVNGLDPDETVAVAAAIRSEGHSAAAFPGDVTDPNEVDQLASAITKQLGAVDVLVINATGPQPEAPVESVTWDDHLDQLAFFVRSPVLLLRELLPSMRARGYGRIIHVDSEVAHTPPPGRSAYVVAKNGQIGLVRAWATELAPLGVTVNTVAPGFIPVERHAGVEREARAAYIATVPAGRLGTGSEIAHAVAFFASDEAGFITGQRLIVDGGRSLT